MNERSILQEQKRVMTVFIGIKMNEYEAKDQLIATVVDDGFVGECTNSRQFGGDGNHLKL